LVLVAQVRLLAVEVLKDQKVRSVASFRRLAVARERILVIKVAMVGQVVAAVVVLDQEFQLWNDLVMTAGLVLLVAQQVVAADILRSAVIVLVIMVVAVATV
jgi:hypothetical protein